MLRCIGKESLSTPELMDELNLADRKNFRGLYLNPSIEAGFVERTVPDKPSSSKQRYRLTALGKQMFKMQDD